MLFSCYDKDSQTVMSLEKCQIDFQKNHKEYAHANFQMEHPQPHLKFLNFKLYSLHMFQNNNNYFVLQKNQVK